MANSTKLSTTERGDKSCLESAHCVLLRLGAWNDPIRYLPITLDSHGLPAAEELGKAALMFFGGGQQALMGNFKKGIL